MNWSYKGLNVLLNFYFSRWKSTQILPQLLLFHKYLILPWINLKLVFQMLYLRDRKRYKYLIYFLFPLLTLKEIIL